MDKQYGNLEKFAPTAFKCGECGYNVSMVKDSYMGECCGKSVMCHRCYGKWEGRIMCKGCGGRGRYIKIRAEFFRSIVDEAMEWKEERG